MILLNCCDWCVIIPMWFHTVWRRCNLSCKWVQWAESTVGLNQWFYEPDAGWLTCASQMLILGLKIQHTAQSDFWKVDLNVPYIRLMYPQPELYKVLSAGVRRVGSIVEAALQSAQLMSMLCLHWKWPHAVNLSHTPYCQTALPHWLWWGHICTTQSYYLCLCWP